MSRVQSKIQPSLLRQLNERQVLAAVQAHGPLSRADITRQTGISGPTVTRAVSSLIQAHWLEEVEPRGNCVGRPGKLVRLSRTKVSVLGLVVGPTSCELVSAGLDGHIEPANVRTFATPENYEALLAACVRSARELMEAHKTTVLGLGLSVPGLINRRRGESIVSPNLHQLDGRNLGDDLRERLQIDVNVLQECHALCRSEQVFGAARGVADFAMLDISEGLGLGVMHGGQLLQGHSGLGGELGHVTVDLHGRPCGCGNRGCLETVATDMALAKLVAERTGERRNIDELLAAVATGRLAIDQELELVLEYLAVGVAAVLNVFNPHLLFIYGRLLDARADAFDRLLELSAARSLAPNWADCRVIRARGSKRLGAVAAALEGALSGWDEAPA
jgi:N-acetylglucosamine repressor